MYLRSSFLVLVPRSSFLVHSLSCMLNHWTVLKCHTTRHSSTRAPHGVIQVRSTAARTVPVVLDVDYRGTSRVRSLRATRHGGHREPAPKRHLAVHCRWHHRRLSSDGVLSRPKDPRRGAQKHRQGSVYSAGTSPSSPSSPSSLSSPSHVSFVPLHDTRMSVSFGFYCETCPK